MDAEIIIKEYQEHLHALGYADTTVELYHSALNTFTKYLTARKITDLRKVDRQILQDYKSMLMEQKTGMETKALKMRPVKRLFEYLEGNNRLLINPAEGLVEISRKNRKIPPVLTVAEVKKILQQPNLSLRIQLRDRTIMEILYSTGIRLNELLNLTIYDPDLKEKTLLIRKGKGGKQRLVPLGRNALQYLKEYLKKIRPRYSGKNPGERTLFLTSSGIPMQPSTVRQAIRNYRIRAGIKKKVSPHTLRRSCATHMLQQGADIRYIQKLLGHSRLSTTQLYTKVAPVDVKKTHERYHPGNN
ncbi:MAG: tyrosine-type recombinase/integrase [Deltaproteobacteria bacterium]|nr:tyrosine-type recombinase/integrase [Deltaproteobacteria bacterium]